MLASAMRRPKLSEARRARRAAQRAQNESNRLCPTTSPRVSVRSRPRAPWATCATLPRGSRAAIMRRCPPRITLLSVRAYKAHLLTVRRFEPATVNRRLGAGVEASG